jgi:CHASE2 domain-containing sensor protein
MSRAAGYARVAAVGGLGLAYAVLAHRSNIAEGSRGGALLALAPMAVAALVLGWRSRRRLPAMALALAACIAALLALPLLQRHTSII